MSSVCNEETIEARPSNLMTSIRFRTSVDAKISWPNELETFQGWHNGRRKQHTDTEDLTLRPRSGASHNPASALVHQNELVGSTMH